MSSFNRFTAWWVVGLVIWALRDMAPDGSAAETLLGMAVGSCIWGLLSSGARKREEKGDG